MNIKIKRIDNSLPLPEYQTKGSVAFDLYAREEITIQPHTIELIPTNLIIQTPPGYMLMLAARSSLPLKKGLMLPNGIGIIDQDYCGAEDEIKLQTYNFTHTPVRVEKGERIGQAIFVRIEKGEFEEVQEMITESRGGFGSTG